MEKETIKKQKSYDETTLYFTAINLIKTIDVYVKNQPLVVRDLYCKELVHSVTNIVHKYKECYNTEKVFLMKKVIMMKMATTIPTMIGKMIGIRWI